MRSNTLALLVTLAAPGALPAQGGHDLQVHALAVIGAREFVGGGLGAGVRLGRSVRLAGVGTLGWEEGDRVAGRGEALVSMHIAVGRGRGPGLYAGGGVAAQVAEADTRGYLALVLGVEGRPAGGGWFVELGVGGGARVAIGYRVIRRRRPR